MFTWTPLERKCTQMLYTWPEIKMFGCNNNHHVWRKKEETCKTDNSNIPNSKMDNNRSTKLGVKWLMVYKVNVLESTS